MQRIGAHQHQRAERNADRRAHAHDADLALVGVAKRIRDEADRQHRVGDQQQRRGDLRIHDRRGKRQEDQCRAESRKAARECRDERRDEQERERAAGEAGREEVGHQPVLSGHLRRANGHSSDTSQQPSRPQYCRAYRAHVAHPKNLPRPRRQPRCALRTALARAPAIRQASISSMREKNVGPHPRDRSQRRNKHSSERTRPSRGWRLAGARHGAAEAAETEKRRARRKQTGRRGEKAPGAIRGRDRPLRVRAPLLGRAAGGGCAETSGGWVSRVPCRTELRRRIGGSCLRPTRPPC